MLRGLRTLRVASAAVLALALAACASLSDKLQAPDVQVVGVQVLSGSMFAQQFKLRMQVKNPNAIELAVRGLEYTVLMEGDSFAEGASNQPFVVPAYGEAEFDMTVTTNFVSAFARLVSRKGGGKLEDVNYEISGSVHLQKGVVRKIPFSHAGTVNFSRLLKGPAPGET